MTNKKKPITPANMEKLAENLIDFFSSKDLFHDVCIYVNNQAWKSDKYMDDKDLTEAYTAKGNKYYIKKNVDIKAQLEYSNPKTISITFEGPLYHVINYDDYDFVYKLSNKFLDPYGLYFEQGYAWSMAAYE